MKIENVDYPMKVVESVKESTITARYITITRRAGNLHFAKSVHRKAIGLAIKYVNLIGMQDEIIVIKRGIIKGADKDTLGMAFPDEYDLYPSCLFYSRALKSDDKVRVNGELFNALEVVIMHELLHLKYPEKEEDWIQKEMLKWLPNNPLRS